MKRFVSILLALAFAVLSCPAVFAEPAGYESEVAARTGGASADPSFVISVSAPAAVRPGKEFVSSVTVGDVKVESGLTIVKFNLEYDSDKIEFVCDSSDFDNHGSLLLNAQAPGSNSWESLSLFKPAEPGMIKVSYATSDPKAAAKSGELVFKFRFRVKDEAEGAFGIWIAHSSAVGYDTDVSRVNGNGGYSVTQVAKSFEQLVGAPDPNAKYNLKITAAPDFYAGSFYDVSVSAAGISLEGGITVVEFDLYYDTSSLEFSYEAADFDSEGALLLRSSSAPGGSWESLSRFDPSAPGVIKISYFTLYPQDAAKKDVDLAINLRFKVKEEPAEETGIWIPTDSVACHDVDVKKFTGNGAFAVAALKEVVEVIPAADSKLKVDTEGGVISNILPGTDVKTFLEGITNRADCIIENAFQGKIGTGTKITCGTAVYTVVVMGDLDGDGDLGIADYILVKRIYLKNYNATEFQVMAGTLTEPGGITPADYIKIKRACLKTYNFKLAD